MSITIITPGGSGGGGSSVPLTSVGAASGVAQLDSGSHVPAAQMRPYNYRGAIAGSTSYAVWDVVVYRGRRILVTTAFTTGAAPVTFVSASNYIPLDPEYVYYAADFGSLTSSPEVAIQAALTEGFNMGLGARIILPQGVFVVGAQIDVPWGCILEGAGKMSTVIQPADASDLIPIRIHKSTGSGNANAMFAGIRNLGVNGRKTTMASTSAHGIILETNPVNTGQTGTSGNHVEFFDPHNVLENVAIRSCKGNGLHLIGRSAHHVRDVWCQNNDGYGFFGTFDTTYTHCEAEGSGKAGWYINNGSQRLVGCKAYLNGVANGDPGYLIDTNGNFANLTGCDAQNNAGPGYRVNGARGVVIFGTADGNGLITAGFGASQGVDLINAVGAIVEVGSINSPQGGAEIGAQRYGLKMTGCSKSHVVMTNSAIAPATITGDVDPSSSFAGGNTVNMNGAYLSPSVELSTNKGQPSGYASLGSDGLVPAGQLPSASGGAAFGNGFFGDGSDGSATLDGTATVTWASKSGSTYTLSKDAYVDSLTVNSGVILRTAGYKLFVKTALVNNGTIHGNGNNATGAAAGAAASGQTTNGGAAGGAGSTTVGANGTGANPGHGGSGGAGGTGTSGAGGTAGAITAPTGGNVPALRALPVSVNGVFSPATGTTIARVTGGGSGGGGGGDGTNSGGGGGGAGQNAIINAKIISGTTGLIQANGGNGANGVAGNSGGGGGGGGGVLLVNTTATPTGQTITANGGTAGSGIGTGTNGTAGSAGIAIVNVFA